MESASVKSSILAPVLGRTVIVLLLRATPYAQYLPRLSCGALVLLVADRVVVLLGRQGGTLLAALGVGFLGFRYWLLIRLGGATGDTLGASCELTEVGVLLGMVVLVAVG